MTKQTTETGNMCHTVLRLVLCVCCVLLSACYRTTEEAERLRAALRAAEEQAALPPVPEAAAAQATTPQQPAPEAAPTSVVIVEPPSETPPAAPAPRPQAAVTVSPPVLDAQRAGQVREGMSLDQVRRILGGQGEPAAGGTGAAEVYRWSSENGATLMAKFEGGVLVRKTVLNLPPEESAESAPEQEVLLSLGLYEQVEPGMTLSEARELLPVEPRLYWSTATGTAVYHWIDADIPAWFTTRFEDDVLVRKSAFSPDGLTDAELLPPQDILEATDPQEYTLELDSAQEPLPEQPWEEFEEPEPPAPLQPQRHPGVRITGELQRPPPPAPEEEADAEPEPQVPQRSYKPKAKLPAYSMSLRRGVYEVRIMNPGETTIQAGLRAGKRGRNVSVPPGGARSIFVDQGTYQVHYIDTADPYTVHLGQTVSIDGQFSSDVEISISGEGSDIGPLSYEPNIRRLRR